MKIGFTGTRNGMSVQQLSVVKDLLFDLSLKGIEEIHHGDCIGSDAQFHDLCENYPIYIHPPVKKELRAFKQSNNILPEQSYLVRNKHIVDQTDLLIATPPVDYEIKSGGTWFTITYARKRNKKIIIIYPNGNIIRENQ